MVAADMYRFSLNRPIILWVLKKIMFTTTITPRFYETDAFGHINNIVVAGWFEAGREDIFRIFTSELDPKKLPLILARIEVDFVAQIYYGEAVKVNTWLAKLGNSSFIVKQEIVQDGKVVAKGKAIQVYFNHATQQSERLPDVYRAVLEKHVREEE